MSHDNTRVRQNPDYKFLVAGSSACANEVIQSVTSRVGWGRIQQSFSTTPYLRANCPCATYNGDRPPSYLKTLEMATTLPTLNPRSWTSWVLLIMASLSLPSQAVPQVSQLYQFTYPTAVQNLFTLPNGCLLLSTSVDSDLYYIDPEALFPSAQRVITLPGSTALASFAALGDGFYAVTGGVPPSSGAKGNLQVHVIKVETEGDVNVTLDHTVPVPDTSSMNGMATLPKHPHTILSADAIGGRILRVNTADSSVTVAFEHAALKPGDGRDASARGGVKGLKIRDGHLYFTNAAKATFGRFPIDANGTNTGDVEILASLDHSAADGGISYDDFGFDKGGNAFVAVHPSSIHKITPGGAQSVFAGGVNSTFLEPTSVVVSNNGKSIYVSTAGRDTGYPIDGGQLLKVQVGGHHI
ncbi:hypothetical protein F5B18DRAFT_595083 [Nemania serpens]|nr:hypothetical protein F5B18DRAFT_595083 [Nemania serpens]